MQKFSLRNESQKRGQPLLPSFGEEFLVLGLLLRLLLGLELLGAVLLELVDVVQAVRDGRGADDSERSDHSAIHHGELWCGKKNVAINTERQQLVVQEVEDALGQVSSRSGQLLERIPLQIPEGKVGQNVPLFAVHDGDHSVVLALTVQPLPYAMLLLIQAGVGKDLVVHGQHQADRGELLRDGKTAVVQGQRNGVENRGEQVQLRSRWKGERDMEPSSQTTCTYTQISLRGKRERLITFSKSFCTT